MAYNPSAHPLTFSVTCCNSRRVMGSKGLIFCTFCDSPGLPKETKTIPHEIKKWDVRL